MARFIVECHTNSDTTESWQGSVDLFCSGFKNSVFCTKWEFGKLVPFTMIFELRSSSLYHNTNVSTVLDVKENVIKNMYLI